MYIVCHIIVLYVLLLKCGIFIQFSFLKSLTFNHFQHGQAEIE